MSQALSNLAIGSKIKIKVDNVDTNFIIVNQGNPSASMYDDSCNGTWLMMEDIATLSIWASNSASYPSTKIDTYLNDTFFPSLEKKVQSMIRLVKIPYRPYSSSSINNGQYGYETKIFILSGYEVGYTTNQNNYIPVDGARLSYFDVGDTTNANAKRLASYNGANTIWWLRSPWTNSPSNYSWTVTNSGYLSTMQTTKSYGVRPAFIVYNTLNVSDTPDGDGCYNIEWKGNETQTLDNLSVGSKIKFGKYSVYNESPEPIIWTVIAQDHIFNNKYIPANATTLQTTQAIDVRAFDASEKDNHVVSNRGAYGNNNYQFSNIDQWLNKASNSGEWYQPAHQWDAPPDATSNSGETNYYSRPGFLNSFTIQERGAILPTEILTLKPKDDTQAGNTEKIVRKVFLPSITEVGLGAENSVSIGNTISYFSTVSNRIKTLTEQAYSNSQVVYTQLPSDHSTGIIWWLRTPSYSLEYGTRTVIANGTKSDGQCSTGHIGICPMINLSHSLPVSLTEDSDGCYQIMWPSGVTSYVGGTETYTENETRNIEVSLEDKNDVLTVDRQDELWSYKYYYENSSVGNSDPYKSRFSNSSGNGMSYLGRSHISSRIGTIITTKITFLKAIPNVKISKVTWRDCIDYFKNDTTLETDIIKLNDNEIYTITATKEQYGTSALTKYTVIARDITIGNISAGDVLSFETKKEGTIDSTSLYNDLVEGLTFFFSSDPITLTETVPVQKTRGINKPVSSIYAGVTATVPKYTETTTTEDIALSTNTFTDFFSADNTGTTGTNAKGITWADNSGGGLKLTFGNCGINNSTSMTTFTAQRDLTNVVIKGLYYTENRYDKITLTVAGTTVLDAVSGTSSTLTQRWTGSLSKGQTIVLKFVKDSSNSATNESSTHFTLSCDPYQKTVTTQTQTGTETKLVDKKIVKGYVGGPDGKARLFFGSVSSGDNNYSFTGESYTIMVKDKVIGSPYQLIALTSSGQLTLNSKAFIWYCGGGGAGGASYVSPNHTYLYSGAGGGGGYCGSNNDTSIGAGTYSIIIGAGGINEQNGGTTSIGDITINGGYGGDHTSEHPSNGKSGGGGSRWKDLVSGDNSSTTGGVGSTEGNCVPFSSLLTNFSTIPHCPGGGSGATYGNKGAPGGTNGNTSSGSTTITYSGFAGGNGGNYGGGNGGSVLYNYIAYGTPGQFYGAGGGGGGDGRTTYEKFAAGEPSKGGSGYQGVVYLLIPPQS